MVFLGVREDLALFLCPAALLPYPYFIPFIPEP
jgi:hypothetical protein